jgi:tetratricopeptide (TPR) repeat protein
LKEFISFIASDDPDNKVEMGNKQKMNFFPTKKLKITIDSANIMNNHVVQPEDAGKIVKEIDFELKDNYLMKGHMMCLDMIATNNWKRPVYFAVSMETSDYLGLEDYFQCEGLTYRLVPIKHPKTREMMQEAGGVATNIMYDNMVNKFRWGGMEGGKIYLDDKIRNMTINLRNNFERLAEALLVEGKKDSAIKVLDKCIEVIPESCVPYDVYMIRAADQYYRAGAMDKADKLIKRLTEIYTNDKAYYDSLKGDDASAYSRDRDQAKAVLDELQRMSMEYHNPAPKPVLDSIPDTTGKPKPTMVRRRK